MSDRKLNGQELATARWAYTATFGAIDAQLVAHVQTIRDAIKHAEPGKLVTSEFLRDALDTLAYACDTFIGWHKRIESAISVRVETDSSSVILAVRYADGFTSKFELAQGRWRRQPGKLCSAADVALESGTCMAYVTGLEDAAAAISEFYTDLSRRIEPEFVDTTGAAQAIGVPVELVENWIAAKIIPYHTFPGSTSAWFRIKDVKRWAIQFSEKHGGLDVASRIEVNVLPHADLEPAYIAAPQSIRDIDGLRRISLHSSFLSGVYFLCDGKEVVYVGQSTCVGGRIGTHCGEKFKKFDSAFLFPCRPDQLEELERKFIDLLMPRYNNDSLTKVKRKKSAAENCAPEGVA